MELIYFISGILTVGIVYGINLLRHVKSSHTELLAKYQSQSNISSIRYGDLGVDLKAVEDLVMDISSKMENCLLYTSPSPRDRQKSRMPSSA